MSIFNIIEAVLDKTPKEYAEAALAEARGLIQTALSDQRNPFRADIETALKAIDISLKHENITRDWYSLLSGVLLIVQRISPQTVDAIIPYMTQDTFVHDSDEFERTKIISEWLTSLLGASKASSVASTLNINIGTLETSGDFKDAANSIAIAAEQIWDSSVRAEAEKVDARLVLARPSIEELKQSIVTSLYRMRIAMWAFIYGVQTSEDTGSLQQGATSQNMSWSALNRLIFKKMHELTVDAGQDIFTKPDKFTQVFSSVSNTTAEGAFELSEAVAPFIRQNTGQLDVDALLNHVQLLQDSKLINSIVSVYAYVVTSTNPPKPFISIDAVDMALYNRNFSARNVALDASLFAKYNKGMDIRDLNSLDDPDAAFNTKVDEKESYSSGEKEPEEAKQSQGPTGTDVDFFTYGSNILKSVASNAGMYTAVSQYIKRCKLENRLEAPRVRVRGTEIAGNSIYSIIAAVASMGTIDTTSEQSQALARSAALNPMIASNLEAVSEFEVDILGNIFTGPITVDSVKSALYSFIMRETSGPVEGLVDSALAHTTDALAAVSATSTKKDILTRRGADPISLIMKALLNANPNIASLLQQSLSSTEALTKVVNGLYTGDVTVTNKAAKAIQIAIGDSEDSLDHYLASLLSTQAITTIRGFVEAVSVAATASNHTILPISSADVAQHLVTRDFEPLRSLAIRVASVLKAQSGVVKHANAVKTFQAFISSKLIMEAAIPAKREFTETAMGELTRFATTITPKLQEAYKDLKAFVTFMSVAFVTLPTSGKQAVRTPSITSMAFNTYIQPNISIYITLADSGMDYTILDRYHKLITQAIDSNNISRIKELGQKMLDDLGYNVNIIHRGETRTKRKIHKVPAVAPSVWDDFEFDI